MPAGVNKALKRSVCGCLWRTLEIYRLNVESQHVGLHAGLHKGSSFGLLAEPISLGHHAVSHMMLQEGALSDWLAMRAFGAPACMWHLEDDLRSPIQGRSRRSGWSGRGRFGQIYEQLWLLEGIWVHVQEHAQNCNLNMLASRGSGQSGTSNETTSFACLGTLEIHKT